jgi:polyprenyl-phospho-N-acetylgalactosaminyl synthase
MKFLVIVPAYNEGDEIASVISKIKDCGHDLVVVDDGSIDNTVLAARSAGAKVLTHLLNRGQGASLRTGIQYAKGMGYQAVVFFDADGQMMASDISRLVVSMEKDNLDVVLGSRFIGRVENIPTAKLFTLKLALLFTRIITGLKLTDVHNGFQAWKMTALDRTNLIQDRQAYASEVLQNIADLKLKYCEVGVTIRYTKYSISKGQSILNAFNIIWDLIVKK